MAGGILWHLAAALLCVWFGFLYVRGRSRALEIEAALLGVLARPSDAPAPKPTLVRRALRFCEGECEDVLGTPARLEPPPAEEAARAVADLLGRLAAARDGATPADAVFAAQAGVALPAPRRGRIEARWDGARWTLKESP